MGLLANLSAVLTVVATSFSLLLKFAMSGHVIVAFLPTMNIAIAPKRIVSHLIPKNLSTENQLQQKVSFKTLLPPFFYKIKNW